MSYFADTAEVYRYLGGVFRAANDEPTVGPVLRSANLVLRLDYTNPDATLTVKLQPEGIEVIEGDSHLSPDVRLAMSADNGDRFWRGNYNVAVGLAKGDVKAKGPVSTVLRLIPLSKPLFPIYRSLVSQKDASSN